MCGIVGYIGNRDIVPVLMRGLEHLEYRGYDSAGIACLDEARNELIIVKEKGKLSELRNRLKTMSIGAHIGIGHTRWATHGEPSRVNAHPHLDADEKLVLVHNGIIENYSSLKEELKKKGFAFKSQTDTEVGANLISLLYKKGDFLSAFTQALKKMHGFFAFVVMVKNDPDRLYVFKRSNPIVIGLGKGENFVASDVPPLLPYTNRFLYLEDDEYAVLTRDKVEIFSLQSGKPVKRDPVVVKWSFSQAQKGGYPHFMLKEIFEQPAVVKSILESRISAGEVNFDSISAQFRQRLKDVERVHFVSCGTAYHAGLTGTYMISECAEVPTQATVSSEFRYEDPVVGKKDLVILITQSGETADTLAALREARSKGALTLAIVNVVGSTIAREADSVIYTHAGPEIGVASTKAYVAQLTVIALFALYFGKLHKSRRKSFTEQRRKSLLSQLNKIPSQIEFALKQQGQIKKHANILKRKKNFLYLGRGYNYPNALEGALKLKEISYAHAHGYPAGEMKHGPIALIDSTQPVICICPRSSKTYQKMISNIEEIKARKGLIFSIITQKDNEAKRLSKAAFFIANCDEMLSPILAAIPLQLFAYHVSILNGRDVDQPRNLAKSVTVE